METLEELRIDFPIEQVLVTSEDEKNKLIESLGLKNTQGLAHKSIRFFPQGKMFAWYIVKKGFFKYLFNLSLYFSPYWGIVEPAMHEIGKYPKSLPASVIFKIKELQDFGIETRCIRIIDPKLERPDSIGRFQSALIDAFVTDPFLVVFIDTGNSWGESPMHLIMEWNEKS